MPMWFKNETLHSFLHPGLEPSAWVGRIALAVMLVLLSSWVIAFALGRWRRVLGRDPLLRSCLAWLLPLSLWSCLLSTQTIASLSDRAQFALPASTHLPLAS